MKAWDSIDADRLLEYRREGKSLSTIANAFDVPEYFVRNRCRDLYIPLIHKGDKDPGKAEQDRIRDATRILLRRIAFYHPERAPGISGCNGETKPIRNSRADIEKRIAKTKPAKPAAIDKTSIREVINKAGQLYGVSSDDILGKSRAAELIKPRFAVYYLLNKRLGLSHVEIGKIMQRDHTSVMAGIKRAEELIGSEPLFAMALNAILPSK